jgi:hypothetical protein
MIERGRFSSGLAALFGLGLLLLAGQAQAYPQWQFSSGTSRCSQCHYSPSGGGLINNYGRDAVGEDLSTWEGDGAFMHGAMDLPKAIAIGFDGRYAALSHDVGEKAGGSFYHFPMQADLSLRIGLGDSFSLYVNGGYRGQARGVDEPLGVGGSEPEASSRWISREHWLMWRPEAMGAYVRVGRFFAPYGLRLAEHYTYVRRDSGFNTLEETYSASFGYLTADWELHLTGFMPDVVRHLGGTERGGAGLVEFRLGDNNAVGVQARVGMTDDMYRYQGGLYGKSYFEGPKALLQAEANLIYQTFPGGSYKPQSFNGYLGATFFPGRGFWVTPFAERRQTDISVKDTATNAGGLQLNWFPYPHFEITALGRYQLPAGDSSALTGLLFIHYYL